MAQRTQQVGLGSTSAIVIEAKGLWRRFTMSLSNATGGPAYLGFGSEVASTNGFALPVGAIFDIFLEPNTPLWGIRGTAGDTLTFIEYTKVPPFEA